MYNNRLYY